MSDRELTAELRHRQQQKRASTTILVVLLMLFFAFWYAYSYYRASSEPGGGSSANAESSCTPFDPKRPTPANTTVNVYNATTKEGLAGRTAAALRERGFTVGKVANDPLGRAVAGPAEVRFGPSGKGHAELVVPMAGKGATLVPDKRKDTSVDLVLGAKFTSLAPLPSPTGKPMCPDPSASTSPSRSTASASTTG